MSKAIAVYANDFNELMKDGMMLLTAQETIEQLKGWVVTDCAVRAKNRFHFTLTHLQERNESFAVSDGAVTKREFGIVFENSTEYKFGGVRLTGMERLFVGASYIDEQNHEVVIVDTEGDIFARHFDKSYSGMENPIPTTKEGPCRGTIHRVKMILGRLYFVGSNNTVGYRIGHNQWESLCLNIPMPCDNKQWKEEGFSNFSLEDIDGFSHNDLYAVGGKGNLWHFDGMAWEKISLPNNWHTKTICCAGDGYVYIGTDVGTLIKGKGHDWQIMYNAAPHSTSFNDIVWHANQLWCTSDYSLWLLEDCHLTNLELGEDLKTCVGNLSSAHGVLLSAGHFGAAFHDGEMWTLLFNTIDIQDPEQI